MARGSSYKNSEIDHGQPTIPQLHFDAQSKNSRSKVDKDVFLHEPGMDKKHRLSLIQKYQ